MRSLPNGNDRRYYLRPKNVARGQDNLDFAETYCRKNPASLRNLLAPPVEWTGKL